ncbi:MiaB/RimO family radical SAM methylthiotransferase [Sphingomonas sp. SUN039]|uniref:MiaB/RimO family radical SAM methylthiotransferase n=1 Tax=Sphingomonas sp. SUN039 TaxID=2937787 RepID=UPI00216458DA|nr:radical SAM protein [Sphingomonas sp. SUN039]UVO53825.1 radical SAM protein [Sphingomonas sp. SUN039]
MSVEVLDFGCRLNIAEGAAIRARLTGGDPQVVINSCAVTGEAVRQARQAVRRSARARPGVPITVTGCAAVTDRAAFEAMPEVSRVIAKERPRGDVPAVSDEGHARAFVEVQNGCDHNCTFCVTTIARGASRSFDAGVVVETIARAVERGQREVILTGVDLTSYRPSLAGLVAAILREVPALPRLRLSSLDPAEVDGALFDLIVHEPRIMPHVHLSLQSGDPMILKRMKRRHTREQAIALVERLKAARPGVAVGADLIAGFPTETDAMHASSRAIIDECDIVFGHIFPYSPRAGTPAALMPPVATSIARTRAAELREASAGRRAAWLATLVGTTQTVLVERSGQRGHAPNFATVDASAAVAPGSIVPVRITASDGATLTGDPA